jgi:hypothetical protein
MVGLYPDIEPYDDGLLEVGDGNLVYWEVCGNLAGKPALVLHGGPGSGCTTVATVLRPGLVPDHRVRPAGVWQEHTRCGRPGR